MINFSWAFLLIGNSQRCTFLKTPEESLKKLRRKKRKSGLYCQALPKLTIKLDFTHTQLFQGKVEALFRENNSSQLDSKIEIYKIVTFFSEKLSITQKRI